jgi:hypothetical protein
VGKLSRASIPPKKICKRLSVIFSKVRRHEPNKAHAYSAAQWELPCRRKHPRAPGSMTERSARHGPP